VSGDILMRKLGIAALGAVGLIFSPTLAYADSRQSPADNV